MERGSVPVIAIGFSPLLRIFLLTVCRIYDTMEKTAMPGGRT